MARLLGTRRLTGPNILFDTTGAAAEIEAQDTESIDDVINDITAAVHKHSERVDIGNSVTHTVNRTESGTFALTIGLLAPIDALLTAADLLEVAIASTSVTCEPVSDDVKNLEATRDKERDVALVALHAAAGARDVPFMFDENDVTIGMGANSTSYARTNLPSVDEVPWPSLTSIPCALVTGTNGKTTTTRLLRAILRAAGHVVGATLTDGIMIGDDVIDDGDFSGPGGARRVLRDQRVTAAALETARGGLLRRGLAVTGYGAAVITNVSADHLGEYGVNDVSDMAHAKLIVCEGLTPDGVLVLNGDDATLSLAARWHAPRFVLFGRLGAHQFEDDFEAKFIVDDDGDMVRVAQHKATKLVKVADVPITYGGAAAFNIDNALAAAAAAYALGIDDDTIVAGLKSVSPSFDETPGRVNVVEHNGRTVVVDFAHNPAAIDVLWPFITALAAKGSGRVVFCIGAPGDRSDHDLRALADAVAASDVKLVVVRELAGYERGRDTGAVPAMLAGFFTAKNIPCQIADDDTSGLAVALKDSEVGDVIVFTPVVDIASVRAILNG